MKIDYDDIVKFYLLKQRLDEKSNVTGISGPRRRFDIIMQSIIEDCKRRCIRVTSNEDRTVWHIFLNDDRELVYVYIRDDNDLRGRKFKNFL